MAVPGSHFLVKLTFATRWLIMIVVEIFIQDIIFIAINRIRNEIILVVFYVYCIFLSTREKWQNYKRKCSTLNRTVIHETALQLLQILDNRFFGTVLPLGNDDELCGGKERSTLDVLLSTTYSRSQLYLSREFIISTSFIL